jgi:hypothetical protein
MITYLPDGREVTVTETPGPVFKAVFTGDPDGVFGYGASVDAAVESLLARADDEALQRALQRAWHRPARRPDGAVIGPHAVIDHIDGNPYNNTPGNLMLVDTRENCAAVNVNQDRLENHPARYLPVPQPAQEA